jgi:cell division protein FtsX
MKAGFYWRYATRSLWRGGQRTLLAIFCVAVGVMAIVSLQLVGNMVNNGLTANVREAAQIVRYPFIRREHHRLHRRCLADGAGQ